MHQMIDLAAEFATADVVVITDNVNRRLALRSDPESLDALRSMLGSLGDGWRVPPTGVPVARLRLNFRRGDEPVGNLGVGETFLAAHVHGTFLARESDIETSTRLLEALGAGSLLNRLEGQ